MGAPACTAPQHRQGSEGVIVLLLPPTHHGTDSRPVPSWGPGEATAAACDDSNYSQPGDTGNYRKYELAAVAATMVRGGRGHLLAAVGVSSVPMQV